MTTARLAAGVGDKYSSPRHFDLQTGNVELKLVVKQKNTPPSPHFDLQMGNIELKLVF